MFFLKKCDRRFYDWITDWTIVVYIRQYNNWLKNNNNIYILNTDKFILNSFFFKRGLNWHKKKNIWIFFFSGFYFDDLFSKFIKNIFSKFMILPSFFILDRWFSHWTGSGLTNNLLFYFNKILYFEKINYFFYIFILFLSFLIFVFIVYFSFIFLL